MLDIAATQANPCVPTIVMESPAGCPVISTGALNGFNAQFWWLEGAALVVLGIFFLAVGGRFPDLTLFLIQTFAMGTVLCVLCYAVLLPEFIPSWTVWFLGFITLGIGAGLGASSFIWPKLGISIIGAVMGLLLGQLIYLFIAMSDI
jgi:hypothetical protein